MEVQQAKLDATILHERHYFTWAQTSLGITVINKKDRIHVSGKGIWNSDSNSNEQACYIKN